MQSWQVSIGNRYTWAWFQESDEGRPFDKAHRPTYYTSSCKKWVGWELAKCWTGFNSRWAKPGQRQWLWSSKWPSDVWSLRSREFLSGLITRRRFSGFQRIPLSKWFRVSGARRISANTPKRLLSVLIKDQIEACIACNWGEVTKSPKMWAWIWGTWVRRCLSFYWTCCFCLGCRLRVLFGSQAPSLQRHWRGHFWPIQTIVSILGSLHRKIRFPCPYKTWEWPWPFDHVNFKCTQTRTFRWQCGFGEWKDTFRTYRYFNHS